MNTEQPLIPVQLTKISNSWPKERQLATSELGKYQARGEARDASLSELQQYELCLNAVIQFTKTFRATEARGILLPLFFVKYLI